MKSLKNGAKIIFAYFRKGRKQVSEIRVSFRHLNQLTIFTKLSLNVIPLEAI
jgi:hypothetical protein